MKQRELLNQMPGFVVFNSESSTWNAPHFRQNPQPLPLHSHPLTIQWQCPFHLSESQECCWRSRMSTKPFGARGPDPAIHMWLWVLWWAILQYQWNISNHGYFLAMVFKSQNGQIKALGGSPLPCRLCINYSKVLEGRNSIYPYLHRWVGWGPGKSKAASLWVFTLTCISICWMQEDGADTKEESTGWMDQPLGKYQVQRTLMDILKEICKAWSHTKLLQSAFVMLYHFKSHWTSFSEPNNRKQAHGCKVSILLFLWIGTWQISLIQSSTTGPSQILSIQILKLKEGSPENFGNCPAG